MTSTLQQRLESWREVERTGKPAWLAEFAPKTIREIEAMIAAQNKPVTNQQEG